MMNLNRMMYWIIFVVMMMDFTHEGTLLKTLIVLGIGFTALWMDAVYLDKVLYWKETSNRKFSAQTFE